MKTTWCKVPDEATEQLKRGVLSPREWQVYAILCAMSHYETRVAFTSAPEIGRLAGMPQRTVRWVLSQLEHRHGWFGSTPKRASTGTMKSRFTSRRICIAGHCRDLAVPGGAESGCRAPLPSQALRNPVFRRAERHGCAGGIPPSAEPVVHGQDAHAAFTQPHAQSVLPCRVRQACVNLLSV